MNPAEPTVREYDPEHGKPGPAVARAHNAQPGDVIEWAAGIRWRWDGAGYHQLQKGDLCRNPRDGSAMLWAGEHFAAPQVSAEAVDELARILDPDAYVNTTDEFDDQDHARIVAKQAWAQLAARRALAHGYVHALARPVAVPAAFHVTSLEFQPGDPVDITWTNGVISHHQVLRTDTDGRPVLRCLDLPAVGEKQARDA